MSLLSVFFCITETTSGYGDTGVGKKISDEFLVNLCSKVYNIKSFTFLEINVSVELLTKELIVGQFIFTVMSSGH